MKTIIVKDLLKEVSLVNYIKNIFPSVNINTIHKTLRKKDIKINGTRINKNITVKNNDIIEIYISDNLLYNLPENIDKIYEDDNVLIVFKPQGLLTNNIENSEPSLKSLLNDSSLTLCHRLDRNTAGLVIFTKNNVATTEMLSGFKNKFIEKNYLAFVYGSSFKAEHDTLEQYIFHDNIKGYSKIIDKNNPQAQKIITEYQVLKKYENYNYSILNVKIHTGKTHQIRISMASIGHPIIGDSKYGTNDINKKFNTYRQLLFAYSYSFSFPNEYKLSYLNNINVKLNKDYIKNSIGCDIIGK